MGKRFNYALHPATGTVHVRVEIDDATDAETACLSAATAAAMVVVGNTTPTAATVTVQLRETLAVGTPAVFDEQGAAVAMLADGHSFQVTVPAQGYRLLALTGVTAP